MDKAKVNEYLRKEIKPYLERHPDLKGVIAWLDKWKQDSGVAYLGLALVKGAGCNVFCSCAAGQITDQIGKQLKQKFPEIRVVSGVAALSPDDIKEAWLKE